MIDYNEKIIPYTGIGDLKLGMNLMEAKKLLKAYDVKYDQWTDANKGFEPEIPWTFIRVENSIVLTFVKNVLFEIECQGKYKGALPNGICIGMNMQEAEGIDPSLKYNDDDEDFISSNGYWLGDEIESGCVVYITIFLPEVELDEKEFWKYEWLDKYISI